MNSLNTSPIEIRIQLAQAHSLVSVYLNPWRNPANNKQETWFRMGNTDIRIGDSTTQTVVKQDIFEGGFYEVTDDTSGDIVLIYRASNPNVSNSGNWKQYGFNAIKLYQVPNLISLGASVYLENSPQLSGYEAQNLLEHLDSRTTYYTGPRIIDLDQNTVTPADCCYMSDKTNLEANDFLFVLGIDLG